MGGRLTFLQEEDLLLPQEEDPRSGDVRPQELSRVWTLTQEAARTPIPAEMDIDELQDSEVQVPQSGSVMSPGDMMEDPAWVF